jgi:hypothetical protein
MAVQGELMARIAGYAVLKRRFRVGHRTAHLADRRDGGQRRTTQHRRTLPGGMTQMKLHGFWIVVLLVTVSAVGCGQLPFGGSSASNEDDLSDLAEDESSFDDEDSETVESSSDGDVSLTLAPSEFSLQLTVGQKFPLQKTIEQQLTQQFESGPSVGYSKLELLLSLVVEEVQADRSRLSVRYHRVRYAQQLGEQSVEYHSDRPPSQLPVEVLPYAGLPDNGFSFWLSRDHKIMEVVGWEDFLKRCAMQVPAEQRSTVWAHLAALRSEDSLANFVDDSIGLLPSPDELQGQDTLQVGSVWERRPQSGATGTEAVGSGDQFSTRCLLKALTPNVAEISLMGSIAPATYLDDISRVRITVKGGQCVGSCRVDRSTGMPTQSRMERTLHMVAELPDGTSIEQRKDVITTTTAFLDQGNPSGGQVTQAGHQSEVDDLTQARFPGR